MRNRLALPLFLAASFLLYANSLGGDFVFDDLSTFQRGSVGRQSFGELVDDYRPVRYLSLRLDRAIFGNRPWGYHLTNTLLHGITSFLVFVVLRRLAGPSAALAGALLFVAHPVHTESVAYISGRRDILTTLFFLLGFLAWLEFLRAGRRRWLGAALGSYALALGAKEMAVTLPAVAVLHDLLADPRGSRRRLPVYAVALALAAGAAAYIAFFSGASRQPDWHGGSMVSNFATSTRLVTHYATLLVFPLRLLGDYSLDAFPLSRSFAEPRVLLSIAALGAALAVGFRARRRAPLVTLSIGWFLVTLLPVLHVKPFHELAAEHYLYLPSFGFCLLAGLGFDRLRAAAGPRAAWAALGIVLALFSARTVVRNRDWKDPSTFWRVTAEAAPRCARAQFNVGVDHAKRSRWLPAAERMERAIAIRPDYITARVQLGRVYGFLGRVPDARAQLEEALRLASRPGSGFDAGVILVYLDRREEAIDHYERNLRDGKHATVSLRGLVECHRELATREAKAGRAGESLSHYRAALAAAERLLVKDPDDVALLATAARLAQSAGDRDRADELFRLAAAGRSAPR